MLSICVITYTVVSVVELLYFRGTVQGPGRTYAIWSQLLALMTDTADSGDGNATLAYLPPPSAAVNDTAPYMTPGPHGMAQQRSWSKHARRCEAIKSRLGDIFDLLAGTHLLSGRPRNIAGLQRVIILM